jgi:hypothetical protein
VRRIRADRAAGKTLREIAADLKRQRNTDRTRRRAVVALDGARRPPAQS